LTPPISGKTLPLKFFWKLLQPLYSIDAPEVGVMPSEVIGLIRALSGILGWISGVFKGQTNSQQFHFEKGVTEIINEMFQRGSRPVAALGRGRGWWSAGRAPAGFVQIR